MRRFLPQDPEKVRWLAQQLAQQKAYDTVRSLHKKNPPPPSNSANLSRPEKYHAAKAFVIFLPNPDPDPAASRGAFLQSVPHHRSNPTLWQCGRGPSFFQLRSRAPHPPSPHHPADPQIKVARPIVARFETKAITSPDYRCALSSPNFLSSVSPWPPCSHHPHFAFAYPGLAVRILRH